MSPDAQRRMLLRNFAPGLTNIRLSHYIITSFIVMTPSGVACSYPGFAGSEAACGGEEVIRKVLLAISGAATIAFPLPVFMPMRRNRIDLQ